MDPQTARVRDIFEDWAGRGRAEGMEVGHGPAARVGFEALSLAAGERYLDIGCGNGYTLDWALDAVGPDGRVVGADVSPAMTALARQRVAGAANATVVCGAFPDIEFPLPAFDAVFSMEVFYYLPDLPAALRATRGALAPGGRFACLVDYYAENAASHPWPEQLGCHMELLGSAAWVDAFRDAGFSTVHQERVLHPSSGDKPGWKQEVGSLLTVGFA